MSKILALSCAILMSFFGVASTKTANASIIQLDSISVSTNAPENAGLDFSVLPYANTLSVPNGVTTQIPIGSLSWDRDFAVDEISNTYNGISFSTNFTIDFSQPSGLSTVVIPATFNLTGGWIDDEYKETLFSIPSSVQVVDEEGYYDYEWSILSIIDTPGYWVAAKPVYLPFTDIYLFTIPAYWVPPVVLGIPVYTNVWHQPTYKTVWTDGPLFPWVFDSHENHNDHTLVDISLTFDLASRLLASGDLVTIDIADIEFTDYGRQDLWADITVYEQQTPVPEPSTLLLLGSGLAGLLWFNRKRKKV